MQNLSSNSSLFLAIRLRFGVLNLAFSLLRQKGHRQIQRKRNGDQEEPHEMSIRPPDFDAQRIQARESDGRESPDAAVDCQRQRIDCA